MMPNLISHPMLEITTLGKCPINCSCYCPQEIYIKQYGNPDDKLSFPNFVKYLSKVPKHVVITFSGFSEPFLNKDAVKMVHYTHEEGYNIAIFSTLVGLTPEDIESFAGIPFELFAIHLPDPYKFAHIPLSATYKETLISAITTIPRTEFKIMNDFFVSNKREQMTRGKYLPKWYPVACEKLNGPQPVLLPNGLVALCCMDFGLTSIIGDFNKEDWFDIIKGEKLNNIRKINRSFFNENSLCKRCTFGKGYPEYFVLHLARRMMPWFKERMRF
jgi:hypothetical protein